MRIGFGFDVHQLVENRTLYIGGIEIKDAQKGALGHSDADVLLHAICDALLGALSLGDIGIHFPNNDITFKNIDSKILLSKTYELITEKGYKIGNIDATVVLEGTKIMAYAQDIKACIASILQCSINQISIKATTNETMGYVGRNEGVCAYAVCLLVNN